MIQYTCKSGDETWQSCLEVVEQEEKYSVLEMEYNDQKFEVFLWHYDKEYWLGIPKMQIIHVLAHPTDEFWNWEALMRDTHNEYFSETVAVGISKYYSSRRNVTNIEEYIKNLKGRPLSYKASVVMYDPSSNLNHLIFMINRKIDECQMLSISLKTKGDYSVSAPFISHLNLLYDQCIIDPDSPYLGKDIRHIMHALERK